MGGGEIRIIGKEEILNDPVAFGLLMEFQYGNGDESAKASKYLFSEVLTGVTVKSQDELKEVIPDLDFWMRLAERCKKQQEADLRLYVNNTLESRLGAEYLEQAGCWFELRPVNKEKVLVHDRYVPLPVLVKKGGITYASLIGIKEFAKTKILEIEYLYDYRIESRWGDKRGVTCFNEQGQEIYSGPIDGAPHPIREELGRQGKEYWKGEACWDKVASWDVGNWHELLKTIGKNGEIVQTKTRTVLFGDDVENLERDDKVITNETACTFQVRYECYFKEGGRLFRLFANISD